MAWGKAWFVTEAPAGLDTVQKSRTPKSYVEGDWLILTKELETIF